MQASKTSSRRLVFIEDGWPILNDVDTDECMTSEARSPSPSPPSSIAIPKLPVFGANYYNANDHSEESQDESIPRPSSRRARRRSSSWTSASSHSSAPYNIESRPRKKNQKEGHIPRPPNGFLMFRSHYMRNNNTPEANKLQNHLSRNAGIVWKKLSPEQQEPFYRLADDAKERHRIKYPNYCYAPKGLGSKSKSKPKRKSTADSTTAQPKPRSTRVAAERRVRRRVVYTSSPSPTPSLEGRSDFESEEEMVVKQECDSEDRFVPTSEIPVLELSPPPVEKKSPEPEFDLTVQPPHLDRIPEQFGVKPYAAFTAMETFLPPLPCSYRDQSSFGLDWDFTGDLTVRDGTFDARFQLGVESLLSFCDSSNAECPPSPGIADSDMEEMVAKYFNFDLFCA